MKSTDETRQSLPCGARRSFIRTGLANLIAFCATDMGAQPRKEWEQFFNL